MISSVSYTPTGSPAHSDSESESYLSAASAASVGSAYSGGGLRITTVINLGDFSRFRSGMLFSNHSSFAFRIFTVSETTLADLNSGRSTLILQPVWRGNPEVATPEAVDKVIRDKRLILWAYNCSNASKLEIFHNDNPRLKNASITRIVMADLDTEGEVGIHPSRVVELTSGKTWLGKNKAAKCLVTKLGETFDRHIDRSKYTASTVSAIVEEQFRERSSEYQKDLSPEKIQQLVEEVLQEAKDGQARYRKRLEEVRKQEAEEARIRERNKLADSLYWNAQKNAYYASQQASRQNGYYTPIPSNLSYATAKSVANDIAGMK